MNSSTVRGDTSNGSSPDTLAFSNLVGESGVPDAFGQPSSPNLDFSSSPIRSNAASSAGGVDEVPSDSSLTAGDATPSTPTPPSQHSLAMLRESLAELDAQMRNVSDRLDTVIGQGHAPATGATDPLNDPKSAPVSQSAASHGQDIARSALSIALYAMQYVVMAQQLVYGGVQAAHLARSLVGLGASAASAVATNLCPAISTAASSAAPYVSSALTAARSLLV